MFVGNCKVCEPIVAVLDEFKKRGYVIKDERVEDYHFQQLHFNLIGKKTTDINVDIPGTKTVENKIICDCHWSVVKVSES